MGDTFIQADWAEILRTKGIRAKGYGLIPKYAMQDPDLKIAEKGLYAYLCSLAGNEFESYPAVSTIKSHLKIGDKAYASYMKQLIDTGYVFRRMTRSEGSRFGKNLYQLSTQPKKFFLSPPLTPKGEVIHKTIRADGLLGGGYGFISRMLTFDARLDIKAKAMYAYLAAFTGAGESAFPSREQMLRELNISKSLFYNCLNPLLELNYITIERDRVRNFERNRYILNDCPDISLGPQRKGAGILDTSRKKPEEECPNLAGTEEEDKAAKNQEIPIDLEKNKTYKFSNYKSKTGHDNHTGFAGPALAGPDTAGSVTASSGTASPAPASTKEERTNNITFPIITPSTTSSQKYQSYLSFPQGPLFDSIRQKFLDEIDKIDNLSREELYQELLSWFSLRQADLGELESPEQIKQAHALLAIMTDFLISKRSLLVKGVSICHEEVLVRYLQLDRNELLETGRRIAHYMEFQNVGNPITYALCALYNQSITGPLEPSP